MYLCLQLNSTFPQMTQRPTKVLFQVPRRDADDIDPSQNLYWPLQHPPNGLKEPSDGALISTRTP